MIPDTTAPGTGERRMRPLTLGEIRAVYAVAVLIGALGLLGFVNSFAAVSAAARPAFHGFAPTVPLGTDLAIAAFSAAGIVLARLNIEIWWVKFIPRALTAATVYLNVADQRTALGIIGHAVFPVLWVLAVELGAKVVRIRAQLDNGTRMDRIRASRWILAPVSTAALQRRMILWEITSYRTALARERNRVLARTELQDAYGPVSWRWAAPRRVRALYRLGELAPADTGQDAPRTEPGGLPALGPVRDGPARTDEPGTRTEDRADETPGVRDEDVRTGPGPEPRTDEETPAPDEGTEPDGPPLSELPRSAIVGRLADEIRDAVDAGTVWKPDYDALQASTQRRRSWCEKVVRDARNRVLDPGGPADGDQGTAPPADGTGRLHSVDPGEDAPDDADEQDNAPLAVVS